MTGPELKQASGKEIAQGALIVFGGIIGAVLLGGLVTAFIFNAMGLAAWLGLPHISYWAAVAFNLVLAAIKAPVRR